ncbi:glycosyltransferase [Acetobacterium sp.]|jgi:cellulose synthase/poly-beta-1,6-N-acetylglucosamine synthase-like glycosyltransferase|uniref:glycosyltransferase family 2 protein n=1 Tax=Acetobacterium sp. TaxID=1872094 RepID=UPI000CB1A5C4|nr:glycosyltransferase [Acetobacterium sp.]MDO9491723.1 glycosyltransferase [Acetobacterium sp.]PKM73698.1 MAG: glycosyl transferase family 2 [Firmicutes bacterium HGW-Firmicutes-17]
MNVFDYLMLINIFLIWSLLFVNIVLIVAGYVYYLKVEKEPPPEIIGEHPFVSIMVPAHNEGVVIVKTVTALLAFDYPWDRYEIIVINDNSSDNSAELLKEIQDTNPSRNLTVINTDNITGGKGKSNALNIGYQQAKGEFIAIYDADNTPEHKALRYLAAELKADDSLGAVIGKFRTRNKEVNLLTRFINIETLSFQWMAQAGRWQLMKLCTIPGTNFILRRTIIEAIGGWDEKAVAEDTEISFRIYLMGYKIKFQPKAVTWEQEPQTLGVWFRQRTRWVKGNVYVLIKNIGYLVDKDAKKIRFDIFYFLSTYFLLLTALVVSDIIFFMNMAGLVSTTIQGFSNLLWFTAFIMFILGVFIALTTEKGEMTVSNFFIIALMYFTYCQMWIIVTVYGVFQYLKDRIKKQDSKWYKTERFQG